MDDDIRHAALARLYATVDAARCVFRGMVLTGHRESLVAGEMYWALPGGVRMHGSSLMTEDPAFQVVAAPSSAWLREQQSIVAQLQAGA